MLMAVFSRDFATIMAWFGGKLDMGFQFLQRFYNGNPG